MDKATVSGSRAAGMVPTGAATRSTLADDATSGASRSRRRAGLTNRAADNMGPRDRRDPVTGGGAIRRKAKMRAGPFNVRFPPRFADTHRH